MFDHKNLLSIDELSAEDIMTVLTYAKTFEEVNERPIKKVPALRGKTICNLFLEPSTRTRGSFELAEKASFLRYDQRRRFGLFHGEGREPCRHRQDARFDEGRHVRRAP